MRLGTAGRVAALAMLTLAPDPASGQDVEEILSYDVTVVVEHDGSMEVTEEIRVRALGGEIRHGIYRDIPTSFPRQSGFGRVTAPLDVVRVLLDGRNEPYVVQSVGGPARRGGIRIRIGDADVFVSRGEHTYLLTYRTARWLTFGETFDELYWNVTGNGWSFPILAASARVALPGTPAAQDVTLEGWTGPEGSTASDLVATYEAEGASGSVANFRTTARLGPMEGLTIRVRFPKGLVATPDAAQESAWFRLDWGPWIDATVLAGLVLSLYLLMWSRVGRDPPARTHVVQYEPPAGFSAAALGYIRERGYQARHLVAAVVSLGVKGALTIEREGRKWILHLAGGSPPDASPEEAEALRALWASGGTVTLTGNSNPTVRKAARSVRSQLRRTLARDYFVNNRGWFLAGLAVTLAGFAALTWRARFSIPPEGWFMGIWLSGWSLGVGALLARAFREWRQALGGDVLAWLTAGFTSLFSIPFIAAELFVGYLFWQAAPRHLLVAALVLATINVLFYELLERPTLKGRGVLDQLEGFATFLTSTEADRYDRLQPEDRPLELFERYLPHAIALGVENRWAERFEGVLDAPTPSGGDGSSSSWYSANGSGRGGTTGMASALGGAFSSSLSASSAAPSSGGGGGGGGGSSGGGGGGGGGGGW